MLTEALKNHLTQDILPFWLNLIDRVTVYEDGSLVFCFKNGAEITEML